MIYGAKPDGSFTHPVPPIVEQFSNADTFAIFDAAIQTALKALPTADFATAAVEARKSARDLRVALEVAGVTLEVANAIVAQFVASASAVNIGAMAVRTSLGGENLERCLASIASAMSGPGKVSVEYFLQPGRKVDLFMLLERALGGASFGEFKANVNNMEERDVTRLCYRVSDMLVAHMSAIVASAASRNQPAAAGATGGALARMLWEDPSLLNSGELRAAAGALALAAVRASQAHSFAGGAAVAGAGEIRDLMAVARR